MWSTIRAATAAATAGVVLLAGSPVASGEPADPAFPSRRQVDVARERAAATARHVEAIRGDYAAADRELERLGLAAAQAAETYNGALWRLEQARGAAAEARRKARRAQVRTARQRQGIGALVAETYQGGSDLGQVSAYLAAEDPDALLDRFAAFKGASSTMQAGLDRFHAVYSLQRVFEREAARAVAASHRAEQQARAARRSARQAVAAQQVAVEDISDRKEALVRELARAQSISVELASQRQQALERRAQIRRQRAAEQAAARARERAAAEAAQRAAAAREAREAREAAEAAAATEAREARARAREATAAQQAAAARRARAEERAQAAQQARRARVEARVARAEARRARMEARDARAERGEARRERLEQRREARQERLQRRRQAHAASYSSGAASQAVAFAMDQVGEPYVWGGDGPDEWDCSGLTAGAWGSAGRYLSHYSVAQYYETTRIGYADLRPGDLIFWSSDGTPNGIFHVALYIGDGRMVHAANPSDPVKVDSVWYWRPPDFFGRI